LRRLLKWIIGLPVALFAIAFAVANRKPVTLSFDPMSQDAPFASMVMPLWLLFFIGTIVGVLVGWLGCWMAQGKWRKRAREQEAEVKRLLTERDRAARDTVDEPETALIPMGTGWT
jgi:uncharacterized integral membrane protein